MLEIHNLYVSRSSAVVLHDISLSVPSGGAVGVFGANGAGKTTLVQTISGFTRANTGTIRFKSSETAKVIELNRLRPYQIARLGILQVPERRALFNNLSVKENLLLGATHGEPHRCHKQSLDMVFALFPNLMERQAQIAGRLSGGEQQMLAIAKALMGQPKLLILDELSIGLSPTVTMQVYQRIEKLRHEINLTVLISEQSTSLALEFCQVAYVLRNGTLVWEGQVTELTVQNMARWYLGV